LMACGAEQCTAQCLGVSNPNVVCGSSCGCTGC
jgi:hypothetical protein